MTAAALDKLLTKVFEKFNDENETEIAFDEWRTQCEQKYPQSRYWSVTLKLESIMLSFVRSIRTGNFKLHKDSIQSLLPWFFALDHINYTCWLSIHLMDMLTLHKVNESVAQCFENGMFVVRKTEKPFSSISMDHAHEQNSKCVKGNGGLIMLFFIFSIKHKISYNFTSVQFNTVKPVYSGHLLGEQEMHFVWYRQKIRFAKGCSVGSFINFCENNNSEL